MKVADLAGPVLDYWVARALGVNAATPLASDVPYDCDCDGGDEFRPSSRWAHGGPIIERERISLFGDAGGRWLAERFSTKVWGETLLVAAMRCYVASKFGEEVPEPTIDAPGRATHGMPLLSPGRGIMGRDGT